MAEGEDSATLKKQEVQLKATKEGMELQTLIVATDAKLKVLEKYEQGPVHNDNRQLKTEGKPIARVKKSRLKKSMM